MSIFLSAARLHLNLAWDAVTSGVYDGFNLKDRIQFSFADLVHELWKTKLDFDASREEAVLWRPTGGQYGSKKLWWLCLVLPTGGGFGCSPNHSWLGLRFQSFQLKLYQWWCSTVMHWLWECWAFHICIDISMDDLHCGLQWWQTLHWFVMDTFLHLSSGTGLALLTTLAIQVLLWYFISSMGQKTVLIDCIQIQHRGLKKARVFVCLWTSTVVSCELFRCHSWISWCVCDNFCVNPLSNPQHLVSVSLVWPCVPIRSVMGWVGGWVCSGETWFGLWDMLIVFFCASLLLTASLPFRDKFRFQLISLWTLLNKRCFSFCKVRFFNLSWLHFSWWKFIALTLNKTKNLPLLHLCATDLCVSDVLCV